MAIVLNMPWPLTPEEKLQLVRLGERVKDIRTKKGWSLEEVAQKIDKDRQSIHKLEKGNFNPSYIYLTLVARGLEVEISELVKLD